MGIDACGPEASELPDAFVVKIPSRLLLCHRARKPCSQALPLLRRCSSLIVCLRTIKTYAFSQTELRKSGPFGAVEIDAAVLVVCPS